METEALSVGMVYWGGADELRASVVEDTGGATVGVETGATAAAEEEEEEDEEEEEEEEGMLEGERDG